MHIQALATTVLSPQRQSVSSGVTKRSEQAQVTSSPPLSQIPPQGSAIPCLHLCVEPIKTEPWTPEARLRLERTLGTAEPAALIAWARQTLGLDGVELLDAATRQINFLRFAQRHFPQPPAEVDEFASETYGPTPEMPLYKLFEAYAQTDYGALMIQKVLTEAGHKPFVVKAIAGVAPKAWDDLMVFPPDFPKPGARFAFGGQEVDPLAILHHEFEHTRFGKHPQSSEQILAEEAFTVAEVENPVRILNGFEPRYTYTQLDASGRPLVTLNIFNPTQQAPGAWTFDPQDPRQLRPLPERF